MANIRADRLRIRSGSGFGRELVASKLAPTYLPTYVGTCGGREQISRSMIGPGNKALRKGRFSEPGRAYLVTTVTNGRAWLFTDLYVARAVIAELRRCHEQGDLDSLAWVLMPHHLHWLFALKASATLPRVMQAFKSRSAIAVNRHLERQGPVWQAGYHDHALRREEDLRGVARYVIANPLRAGLVKQIGDYPHWDAVWL